MIPYEIRMLVLTQNQPWLDTYIYIELRILLRHNLLELPQFTICGIVSDYSKTNSFLINYQFLATSTG